MLQTQCTYVYIHSKRGHVIWQPDSVQHSLYQMIQYRSYRVLVAHSVWHFFMRRGVPALARCINVVAQLLYHYICDCLHCTESLFENFNLPHTEVEGLGHLCRRYGVSSKILYMGVVTYSAPLVNHNPQVAYDWTSAWRWRFVLTLPPLDRSRTFRTGASSADGCHTSGMQSPHEYIWWTYPIFLDVPRIPVIEFLGTLWGALGFSR